MPTVYITSPPEAASDIAETLVEERLAACVNLVDCDSVYRWNDSVTHGEEVILLAKTTGESYAALVERVETLHPHDVPCIERFDETDMLAEFGDWIQDATEP